MLLIPCIHCGPRAEVEFSFGGEAGPIRPGNPSVLNDEQWSDYLYTRRNLQGPSSEYWVHSGGCGQWFVLTRDTATHKILESCSPADASGLMTIPDRCGL